MSWLITLPGEAGMWKNQQYVLQGGFKKKQTEHEKNKT